MRERLLHSASHKEAHGLRLLGVRSPFLCLQAFFEWIICRNLRSPTLCNGWVIVGRSPRTWVIIYPQYAVGRMPCTEYCSVSPRCNAEHLRLSVGENLQFVADCWSQKFSCRSGISLFCFFYWFIFCAEYRACGLAVKPRTCHDSVIIR